jgi:hypothetical protein
MDVGGMEHATFLKTLVNKGVRQSAGLAEIDDRARVRRGEMTWGRASGTSKGD